MITFNYVKYRNILSTGNTWTHIDLNVNKSTLIVGENGAGKSTMLDAICFAIYGKPFRKINKPQLINSINQKGLEVEVAFDADVNKYVVKRGMKPNLFEIWKNGELLNQDAASRDYQAYLEQNILKMNFKSFGQIVVLGSSTFVPFMQLPAQHRREIIEDLLDIQIFSTMNVLLKDKISTNKSEITDIKYEIELLKNNIELAKSHNDSIRKIKETEVSRIKEKVRDQLAFIEEQNAHIAELNDSTDSLIKSIEDKPAVKKKLNDMAEVLQNLTVKQTRLKKEVGFYHDNDSCPTCKQGIDHEFKQTTVEYNVGIVDQITIAVAALKAKNTEFETRLKEISEVEDKISAINLSASTHRANIKIAMATLGALKNELQNAEKEVQEVDASKIFELEEELRSYHNKQSQLHVDRETMAVVGSMLKDGGIKTRIIRQYVPVMNKLINKYLASMEFFVQFELDENFEETIKSRFRDVFSYGSFSEGEKLRIDLALLFTWRAVSKLRNSVTTNLLIMDEIMDSSLDNSGTEEFLKIIHELTADSNVFIISHKGEQLHDKFDHIIKFEKVKNFSRMAA